ncbi:hypothetical protein I302_100732 [Kwoniella bestiolae CBS 10118]|uniref:Zn(2)-C6 fungal-type domain-containing protein n=1 Tax=Kwoniella bestiolae CBS 10118 TaxID=1296100 RepID=A0A1B9G5Z1_9TREE|nr:hypothetical protein I302_04107 [Kwoniella bestiolae CBS 10118]OCF26422.1 hypothetical protein I302_04107 [Kwoniella bestiolae CBS 10118]
MSYHPYSYPSQPPQPQDQQQYHNMSDPSSVSPLGSDLNLNQQPKASGSTSGIGKWNAPVQAQGPKAAPVKAACLSCRNKKAKCDGKQPVCGQCARKNLECVFVKSRRGGARKRRPVIAPTALSEFLKKLDTLLMAPALDHGPASGSDDAEVDLNQDTTNIVKRFSTAEEVFESYYTDVHPFVTVMPPRTLIKTILPTLLPNSPFLLAVQTILVLAPHANDPNPSSSRSKKLRQAASISFAEQTMKLVEFMASSGQLNLECVQATAIIALWEWSAQGSVTRNKELSEQSIRLAMQLGLHELDKYTSTSVPVGPNENGKTIEGEDWRRDMARRTWWTTFTSQLTAALVSGNQPVVGPDDPRVYVDYPICSAIDHSWANFIDTVKSTIRVFNLVISVYFPQITPDNKEVDTTSSGLFSASNNSNVQATQDEEIRQKMYTVDKQIMDLIKQAEQTAVIDLVPGGEEEVARNQQLQARLGLAVLHIHIHRWQAFPEVSLFSKRICGLPQAPDFTDDGTTGTGTPDYQYQQQQLDGSMSNQDVQMSGYNDPNQPYNGYAQAQYDQSTLTQPGYDGQSFQPQQQGNEWAQYDPNEIYEYAVDDMWAPEIYPESLPAPWFTYPGGAAQLYAPTQQEPNHYPEITPSATIGLIPTPPSNPSSSVPPSDDEPTGGRRVSTGSSISTATNKPHKAWGVDEKADKVLPPPELQQLEVFPPGISLARCATAAHTIVRLEVLHRSAVIAMWDGPPKWPPFCSCGLVTGAYAFLLLALAVQAENTFSGYTNSRSEEVEALLTNVKVILAGLEAYGTMWAGIDAMAGEVRAALEAATRLPFEVSAQIESANSSTASPSTQGGMQE